MFPSFYSLIEAFLNNNPERRKIKAKNPLRTKTPITLGDQEVAGGGQINRAVTGTNIWTIAATIKV